MVLTKGNSWQKYAMQIFSLKTRRTLVAVIVVVPEVCYLKLLSLCTVARIIQTK